MSHVLLLWFISLSCKVVMTGCEVVWVNRNVTDSFRVGKDGCKNDTSVCPSTSICQTDSGLCLCRDHMPNFRNPNENLNDKKGYGCISGHNINSAAGECLQYCLVLQLVLRLFSTIFKLNYEKALWLFDKTEQYLV